MCRKELNTQKKWVKISKIRLKEVIFTALCSKARILRRLWKILRRRASVCLPLLEPLCKTPLLSSIPDSLSSSWPIFVRSVHIFLIPTMRRWIFTFLLHTYLFCLTLLTIMGRMLYIFRDKISPRGSVHISAVLSPVLDCHGLIYRFSALSPFYILIKYGIKFHNNWLFYF